MSSIADVLRGALAPARPDPPLPAGTPAAVMIPVIDGEPPTLVLTVRSEHVRDHKGEISFPGGVRHEEDADLLRTALRETDEELGIPPGEFEVLGALPPVHTVVTGYVILPFVGRLPARPEMRPSPVEIGEILELEVPRLAAVEQEVARGDRDGDGRTWFAYTLDGHTVWGATGRIVHAFIEALRGGGWKSEGRS